MTTHNHSHSHDIDFKTAFTVEKLPGSLIKISGEIPYSELEKERSTAIKTLGKNITVDGFRKGHVPDSVLVSRIGEMNIIAEMAERALAHCYPHILDAHEIDAIGQPQVEITKIAKDNPLGFTATVAVLPAFSLPKYADIAKTANTEKLSEEVTDEEVENQIKDILRQKIAYERIQKKASHKAEGTPSIDSVEDLPTPESEVAKQEAAETAKEPEDHELPELTDELVKTLGQPGQFENVDMFKAKLREHLTIEKERDNAARHRAKITDAIIEQTKIELPQTLIDAEIGQLFAQMEDDLKRANLRMDDYLTHIKKTREDLTKEWTPSAEKRAKLQLILNEIAKDAGIKPDADELDRQTAQLMEQYKDADEQRVRIYVASTLLNEAVMKHLEAQV